LFERNKAKRIDVDRMAAAALESFLGADGRPEEGSQNGSPGERSNHRYGGVGALALGVALSVAARVAYSRVADRLDLDEVVETIEERLAG
jgi:hypothetical protein